MHFFGWNIVLGLLVVYPLWRVYERVGLNPLFALLVFFPGLGWLLALLPLAFQDWPNLPTGRQTRR